MSGPGDDHLTLATAELGTPEALFHISPGWLRAKLAVALGLVLFGVAVNYWWWAHGPANFNHLLFHLLFWPPLLGGVLVFHMYRHRGLFVLVYPTGLLRLRRGEVDSYPWDDITEVRVKVQRADAAEEDRDEAGNVIACWLPAEVPAVQIWNAGLTVVRADGAEAHFGAALADYEELAAEIQRRTFPAAWAAARWRFRAGRAVEFGEVEVTPSGIRTGGKFLPWPEVKDVTVAQGMLSIKQAGRWLPWAVKAVNEIPNPHVLFALVAEARKPFAAAAARAHPGDADPEG